MTREYPVIGYDKRKSLNLLKYCNLNTLTTFKTDSYNY